MTFLGLMRLFGRGPVVSPFDAPPALPSDLQHPHQCLPLLTPPQQEAEQDQPAPEFLEIDYEQEMEECSRYTFSAEPFQPADPLVGRRLFEGFRAHCQESEQEHQGECEPEEEQPRPEEGAWGAGLRERFTSAGYDCISLRLLLGEARRLHLARCGGVVTEARRQWHQLALTLADELGRLSFDQVRRNVASCRLFDLPATRCSRADDGSSCAALYSGNGVARVRAMQERKERLLRRLRERNALFWTGEEPPHESAMRRVDQREERPFTRDSAETPPPQRLSMTLCDAASGGLRDRGGTRASALVGSASTDSLEVAAPVMCGAGLCEGLSSVGLTSCASSCADDGDEENSARMGDDDVMFSCCSNVGHPTPLGARVTGLLTVSPGT